MKNNRLTISIAALILVIFIAMTGCKNNCNNRKNYRFEDNTIVFNEPQRIEGQTSMLQFAAEPIENVRIGFIGLGMRGPDAVYRMTYIDGVEVVALCDLLPENVEKVQKEILEAKGLPRAAEYVGEVIHGEGAYIHNLEPYWHEYQGNWRLDFNQKHSGDVYATHGLGPICQVLDIHRGDRMEYLVSMSTPSYNGKKIAKEMMGTDEFANGDMTTTMIETHNGKTILIEHNVYTYRPYNRLYQLTGTEGFANKYPIEGFTLMDKNLPEGFLAEGQHLNVHGFVPKDVREKIMKEYTHPIAKDIEELAKKVGGHGGMDFIMDYRLIYCLQNGLPLDEDVYDAAEWSCIGELSAASIENHGMPVKMPDFTRGDWNKVKGYKHAMK